MLKIVYTATFEKSLVKLDKPIIKRILQKINNITGDDKNRFSSLSYSPKELSRLRKLRVGDWRVLFWLDEKTETIMLYLVEHRSNIYKNL